MNRSRLLWVVVAAAIAGLAVWWLAVNLEYVEVDVHVPDRGAAARDPHHAAKQVLRQLGTQVVSAENLSTLPPRDAVLVLSSPYWTLLPGRSESLAAWVRAGGRLVLVDHAWRAGGKTVAWLPLRFREPPRRRPQAAASAAASSNQGDAATGEDDGSSHDDNDDTESPTPGASAASAPSTGPVAKPGRRPAPDPCHAVQEAIGQPAFADARPYVVCMSAGYGVMRDDAMTWGLVDADGDVQVARAPLGDGSVTLNLYYGAYANRNVVQRDGAAVMVASLGLRGGDTVWFVGTEARQALLPWLWAEAAPLLVTLGVAVLLALWPLAVRFGPLRADEATRGRRSAAEQIRRTADFLASGRKPPERVAGLEALHTAAVRALDAAARMRVPGYAALDDDAARAAAIAAVTGGDAARLAQARLAPATRAALAASVAELERHRRALRPERHRRRDNASVLAATGAAVPPTESPTNATPPSPPP